MIKFIIFCLIFILFLFLSISRFRTCTVRGTVLGILFLLLGLLALGGAILFPPHSTLTPTGSYLVQKARFELTEDKEDIYLGDGSNRKISYNIYYPEGISSEHSCPLVIFSHGGLSVNTQNETLFNELASHGYVVASINHTDLCLYTKVSGKSYLINRHYRQELSREDASTNPKQSYTYYQKWMNVMIGDIDTVIDNIKKKNGIDEHIYKLINKKKIAVMGHSLGGSAALGIGRTRKDVSAVIALESPYLYDIKDCKDGKFIWNEQPYPTPVLNLYTDSSFTHLKEWPQYKQNANYYDTDNPRIKNVRLYDCGHFSITDLSLTSPVLTRLFNGFPSKQSAKDCLKQVNQECITFLKDNLK